MVKIPAEIIIALNELKERLRSKLDIEKIIVFGSYARGSFTPDSDIDVCIIANNIGNNFGATLTASGIAALVDPRIEPVVYSNEDYLFDSNFGLLKEIKKSGIEV